jgi:hypothetical protein
VQLPLSIICLFCEDIRQEDREMNTLVGILPDNVTFPGVPAIIPKLGVYVRVSIDVSTDPGPMEIVLSVPGRESRVPIGTISQGLVNKAKEQAHSKGSQIAGIIARAVFSPFEVVQAGRIRALALVGGKQVLCGGLNIEVKSPAQASVPTVS